MPSFVRKAWLIYCKDLREEFRTTDHLLSTLVFGTMLVFVFSFALQLVEAAPEAIFPAVLWVSIVFMAILALQRSFAKERQRRLDALLLAAGDRSILFYAKFLFSPTVLLLLEVIVVPLLWVFMGRPEPRSICRSL